MQAFERVEVFKKAFFSVRDYRGKTIVIKYGGSAMGSEGQEDTLIEDIVLLKNSGINIVLVHGGGKKISEISQKLGITPKFVNGLRVTDEQTVEVVEMVLSGQINKKIVSQINRCGGKAVGLSGKDGGLLLAEKDLSNGDIGFVGRIKSVNAEILDILSREGYISVVSPVTSGEDGRTYNINADTAAGEIAAGLGAEKLILLTDVEGVYEDRSDKTSLIRSLKTERALELIKRGVIDGGMIPKIMCCVEAVKRGVKKAHIVDGRVPHAVLLTLFDEAGVGTTVEK
ncbi:acetylglutamate kinase [Thermovorax subterraneus]|nr:acetylglutamate kinase [Thermovorax subterraneus]